MCVCRTPSVWMYLVSQRVRGVVCPFLQNRLSGQLGFRTCWAESRFGFGVQFDTRTVFCSISRLMTIGEMWPIFRWSSLAVCTLTPVYAAIFAAASSLTRYRPCFCGILPICIPFESLIQQDLSFSTTIKPAVSHFASDTNVYPKSGQYSTSFSMTAVLSLWLGISVGCIYAS